MHVHVSNTKSRTGNPAKIWLDTGDVFDAGSLTNKEIKIATQLLNQYKDELSLAIRTFAQEGKVKTLQMR